MKALRIITIIPLIFVINGCKTMGAAHLEDDQVAVTVGQRILQEPERLEMVQMLNVVERLHHYIKHYLRKRFRDWNVRKSLKVYVTVTDFHHGTFVNVLGIEILVKENGEDLYRFTEVAKRRKYLTFGSSSINTMSNILAKRIYKRTAVLTDSTISVTVEPSIIQDSQRLEVLQKNRIKKILHEYVKQRFRKGRVRRSLNFEIIITDFQLDPTKDILEVDVIVKENGEELQRFTEVETRQDAWRHSVKHSSKALAERLFNRIKDL